MSLKVNVGSPGEDAASAGASPSAWRHSSLLKRARLVTASTRQYGGSGEPSSVRSESCAMTVPKPVR